MREYENASNEQAFSRVQPAIVVTSVRLFPTVYFAAGRFLNSSATFVWAETIGGER